MINKTAAATLLDMFFVNVFVFQLRRCLLLWAAAFTFLAESHDGLRVQGRCNRSRLGAIWAPPGWDRFPPQQGTSQLKLRVFLLKTNKERSLMVSPLPIESSARDNYSILVGNHISQKWLVKLRACWFICDVLSKSVLSFYAHWEIQMYRSIYQVTQ